MGYGICGIGVLVNYGCLIYCMFGLFEFEIVVCGIVLGWFDW